MNKHTSLPWERSGVNGIHKRISSHYATCIATTDGDNREANRDFIFMAAHCHQDLVDALQDALDNCLWRSDSDIPLSKEESQRIWEKAVAALEKAKGGKP